MLSTVENEWHGIPTFLGLKTIYVNVEKKSKVIADLHVTKTINSSVLTALENRYPCTIKKSLKIFGIIVEIPCWFVTQQQ